MGKASKGEKRRPATFQAVSHQPNNPLKTLPEEILYGLLFFFITFLFSTSIEVHFTLPKLAALRILTLLLCLLWMYRLKNGEVKKIPRPVFYSSLFLGIWWLISTFFAIHVSTALNGVYGRYNGLWTHVTCLMLFLITATLPLDEKKIEIVLRLFIIALVPVSLYAVLQYFGLDPFQWPTVRPASTIGHPVILAALLGLGFPFALMFHFRSTKGFYWAPAIILISGALVVTLSRGPWVSVLISSVLFIVAAIKNKTDRSLKTSLVVSFVLISVMIVFIGYKGFDQIQQRIKTYTEMPSDVSVRGRLIYYDAALKIIRESPVFGTGFESFRLLYPRFRPPEDSRLFADITPTMVHNGYLQTTLSNGIPALVLYLLLLFSVLALLLKAYFRSSDANRRILLAAFAASIIGYMIQDLTGWMEIALTPFFWIILGLSVSVCTANQDEQLTSLRWSKAVFVVTAASLALLAMLSVSTVKEIHANRLFWESRALRLMQDWPEIEGNISEALAQVPGDYYYEDMAAEFYLKKFETSGAIDHYRKGAELLENAATHNPFDIAVLIHRIRLDVTALERKTLDKPSEFALKAAEKLLTMDRNNPAVYEAVARLRSKEKRFQEALGLLEKAEVFQPGEKHFLLYGDIFAQSGNAEKAVSFYRKAISSMEAGAQYSPDWIIAKQRIAFLLMQKKEYSAALNEIRDVTIRFPENAPSYVLMGDIYAWMGDYRKAGESFETALKYEPSNPNARRGVEQLRNMLVKGN